MAGVVFVDINSELNAVCKDMQTIKMTIQVLLRIPHPSAYNKAQIAELAGFYARYEQELIKLGNQYCV